MMGNPMMQNPMAFQQPWMNRPMMMNRPPVYQPPPQQVQAQKEELKQSEQPQISDVSGNMVEVLTNSANPKHRNSEFLKFLNKLNTGALKIEGDQLIEDQAKLKEFEEADAVRFQKDLERQAEDEKFRKE